MAQTDLAVQFVRDSSGRAQMVTTRVPHASDWNPFIEAGDDMRQVQGSVQEIDCGDNVTRFVVESGGARLRLTIEDPARVRLRNAPPEFVSAPHQAHHPLAQYQSSQ